MFTTATTIDEVIEKLTTIIAQCEQQPGSRLGYFATLYLKVTAAVKLGIANNQFQNGPRMEQLDVTFANRYLDAYYQWQQKQEPTASWKLAFQSAQKSSVLILEHLLLGMSAHINLDLGIATAQTVGSAPLQDIRHDFDILNTIIGGLTNGVLAELDQVSPLLSLLGLHAGNTNSVLIQFSIENARDGAWCFAEELYGKTGDDWEQAIRGRDQNILQVGKSLIGQTGLLAFTVWVIHIFEWKNPVKIIRALSGTKKQHFTVGKNLPAAPVSVSG
ncbi:hypothetical protein BEL04_10475 [Mucilaginibacter sp. PPCGB 2223]|uniref:DUF5995 family protein n=1 Tax=Mucilaginibacter sp. PPCGB 2223 TaxID=1886027 RepID=UPI000825D2D3|nr:DUF5995 family protein [Mucilaginibacter sp. PPCGB 2223]OCX54643.1 hypothetical protein BEL04_10475 [Mucilaginibacter sp. PPCGB 2223]